MFVDRVWSDNIFSLAHNPQRVYEIPLSYYVIIKNQNFTLSSIQYNWINHISCYQTYLAMIIPYPNALNASLPLDELALHKYYHI